MPALERQAWRNFARRALRALDLIEQLPGSHFRMRWHGEHRTACPPDYLFRHATHQRVFETRSTVCSS